MAIDWDSVSDEELAAQFAARERARVLAAAHVFADQFSDDIKRVMNEGQARGLSGLIGVLEAQAPNTPADAGSLRINMSTAVRALKLLSAEWQNVAAPQFALIAQPQEQD